MLSGIVPNRGFGVEKFKKIIKIFSEKDKKKGYRCSPTFVNLKSNTMKNTLQRYDDF